MNGRNGHGPAMKKRLIFLLETATAYPPPAFDGLDFRFYRRFPAFARDMGRTVGVFPFTTRLKSILKLMTPSRFLYAAFDGNVLVSYGWVMRGHCRVYPIERDSSIIGPIWTDERYRGRGIALACLKAAVNQMIALGCHRFYIDALETNAPSLRVIQKAGFLGPVRTLLE